MAFKKILALLITSFFVLSLQASEAEMKDASNQVDKCEAAYSVCEEKCMSSDGNKEACLEKCDDAYSQCVEKAQAN